MQIGKITALYVRFSYDDGIDAESGSIEHQKALLKNYAESNDFTNLSYYADDGYTGTNFNRPDFQRMMNDIRNGLVGTVIVKDMSRLGRNYLMVGQYVEIDFPKYNVRFIAISDNVDSAKGMNDLLPINNLMNEWYSRDISKKIRSMVRQKGNSGQHITSKLPYGYYNTSENRQAWMIDEEAEIVRMIFADYLSGMGKLAIANQLNEQGILTKNGNQWSPESVMRILRNEKYAGTMILQKFYSENHITKRKMTNEGQLQKYIIDESHPAIIERHIFDAVQEQKKQLSSEKSTTSVYPFTGKIQCCCCGKNYRRKTTATGVVWICATYNTKGKKYCPAAKQIPENTLIDVCCEVLEISEFDADIFENQIEKILVPAPNELIFVFHDGNEISANWKDRSRSESWTDEMQKKAGERSRKSCPKEQ